MTLKTIQITDGEMEFADNTLTELTEGDALAQRLVNRLTLYLQSWFVTPESGVDWLDILNAKPVLPDRIAEILKAELLQEASVLKITKFDIEFNESTRELTANFEAETDLGLVTGGIQV